MARVFVSYTGSDRAVAAALHRRLVDSGHEVFFDVDRRDGIHVGEGWRQRLFSQIRTSDTLVCVCSSTSVASLWCNMEIAAAIALGTRIVPLSIEPGLLHPLLADLQHANFAADPAAALTAVEETLSGMRAGESWVDGRSPFPGLRAFDTQWQRVFFGRSRETAALAGLLRSPADHAAANIVAVVGPSGCGKSSLVRAGLMPMMAAETDWLVLPAVVPGEDPVTALAREIAAEAVRLGRDASLQAVRARLATDTGLAEMADELLVVASTRHRRRQLLLVIDQFEEVLTRAAPEHRARFGRLLAHAAAGPVSVVTTLRPEFLAPLLSDPSMAGVPVRLWPLRPLDAEALTSVVVEPARVAGIRVDDLLVRRLVAETGTGDALPLLAFTLEQLAAGVERGGYLSPERYDAIGGVNGALASQADQALINARSRSGRSAEDVIAGLLRLVTVDESGRPTRRRVVLAQLPEPVRAELAAFIDRRLVTTDEVNGVVNVGVAHEAFLRAWPPLADAVNRAEAALRVRREVEHAAADWTAHNRPRRNLWGHGQLAAAAENLGVRFHRTSGTDGPHRTFKYNRKVLSTERIDLDEVGQRFLAASVRRDRWLRRRLVTVLSALLLVALAAAGVALVNQRAAQDQREAAQADQRSATARQLTAEAESTAQRDPRVAEDLSLAAYRIHPDRDSQLGVADALTSTLYAGRADGGVGGVRAVAFSPDGRTLAAVGDNHKVTLWDVADLAHPRRLGQPLTAHTQPVYAVTFSPDGHTLATGGDDHAAVGGDSPGGRVLLWDVVDPSHPAQLAALPTLPDSALSLAFAPAGHLLVVGDGASDHTLTVWDTTTPAAPHQLGKPLTGHTSSVRAVAFSPDGSVVASGGGDKEIILWNFANPAKAKPLGKPFGFHTDTVFSLAFSPDGQMLASGSADRTVELWNVSKPAAPEFSTLPLIGGDSIYSVAFAPTGRILASGGKDGRVTLWDIADLSHPYALDPPLNGSTDTVNTLAFAPDGHALVTGTFDGKVILWDVSQRVRPDIAGRSLGAHTAGLLAVALSGDGGTAATAGFDGTFVLWNVADRSRPIQLGPPVKAHDGTVYGLAFDPVGKVLATAGADRTVILWDIRDPSKPSQIAQLRGHQDAVKSVAFSKDGHWLATGSYDHTIMLWDVSRPESPRDVRRLTTGHTATVGSVAFSPDSHTLVSAGYDNTVILWNVTDPAQAKPIGVPLTQHTAPVSEAVFSPDGQTLAASSDDHTVILWDVSDLAHPRELGQPLTGHSEGVGAVAFSPDGKTLATGSYDHTLVLWDISDRSRPDRLGAPLAGHSNYVVSVKFSPDGRTLLLGSGDDTASLLPIDEFLDLRNQAVGLACAYTNGGFTPAEWQLYVPDLPYQPSCPVS